MKVPISIAFNEGTVVPVVVAVSGAPGVGKSTFCSDLAAGISAIRSRRIKTEIRGGVARSLIASGAGSDSTTRETDYPLYVERHFANIVSPTDAELLILDRTIIDTLAYMKVNRNISLEWVQAIETIARCLVKQVAAYFFIPVEFEIVHDGVRCTDPEYQGRIDRAIRDNLNLLHPDYKPVQGTRQQRTETALNALRLAFTDN